MEMALFGGQGSQFDKPLAQWKVQKVHIIGRTQFAERNVKEVWN